MRLHDVDTAAAKKTHKQALQQIFAAAEDPGRVSWISCGE
ncbi:hypothetical protein L195_g028349 [Trifolium pratense]|uniref:Uncharacterized protein n=1 Tax=Trifolium pratense TaxID=57577 RepID=A0A2K3L1Q7_TRIPR|nr:hypothetical protein L195_g028349 [Trifolium pratense]